MTRVNGPLVEVTGLAGVAMHDVIELGEHRLPGEVTAIRGDVATVQAYEYTGGLAPGHPAGRAASRCRPGWARTCSAASSTACSARSAGHRPGWNPATRSPPRPARNTTSRRRPRREPPSARATAWGRWPCQAGSRYRVLVPPGLSGVVEKVREAGPAPADAVIATVVGHGGADDLVLAGAAAAAVPAPARRRTAAADRAARGRRAVPGGQGGQLRGPGGFGTGKTVLLQQITKWCDADVIVYVGCGERGNELADMLGELGRPQRSAQRRQAGRPDRGHREHLQHADDGARGQHLQRRRGRGALQGHGPGRRGGRGLHLALGGGAARVRVPQRRASGRGGVSGQPVVRPGRVLRAVRDGSGPAGDATDP